jgi:hypothetical protein
MSHRAKVFSTAPNGQIGSVSDSVCILYYQRPPWRTSTGYYVDNDIKPIVKEPHLGYVMNAIFSYIISMRNEKEHEIERMLEELNITADKIIKRLDESLDAIAQMETKVAEFRDADIVAKISELNQESAKLRHTLE